MREKGLLIVLSGPAGSGKGTVVKKITETDVNTVCSISATTRAKRPNEEDGIHYFFMDRSGFEEKINKGEMLEYAEYIGNYYGTPKNFVEEKLEQGYNVILEIEVVGALKIKEMLFETVMIFFTPPKMSELERRLKERGTEDEEIIRKRVEKAVTEINCAGSYDYVVINETGQIDAAVKEIFAIITAEKCKRRKNKFLEFFINEGDK